MAISGVKLFEAGQESWHWPQANMHLERADLQRRDGASQLGRSLTTSKPVRALFGVGLMKILESVQLFCSTVQLPDGFRTETLADCPRRWVGVHRFALFGTYAVWPPAHNDLRDR